MSIGLWRMRWGECKCTDSGVGYDVSSVNLSVLLEGVSVVLVRVFRIWPLRKSLFSSLFFFSFSFSSFMVGDTKSIPGYVLGKQARQGRSDVILGGAMNIATASLYMIRCLFGYS